MSDSLYAKVNEFIAITEKIRGEYSTRRQEIKDDENLSIRGRQKLLDELFEAYRDKHKVVMKRYQAWRENTKERVIREVYSHPVYTESGAEKMRPLVERAETAYREGERAVEALTERAINMRDKEMIRALVATSYSRRDWETLQALKDYDVVAFQAVDFETLFGALGSPSLKMQMNLELRPPTKYE